ncbi:MAG TPA: hypothetical protein VIM11_15920 [Tepidisphaeraceae bacterium]|jgi:hypothetical protein
MRADKARQGRVTDAGHNPDLDGWRDWVCLRFNILDNPAWSSSRMILHSLGSQEAAIAELPKLVRQFLAERDGFGGVEGLQAEVRRRFYADGTYGAPVPTTFTTVSD